MGGAKRAVKVSIVLATIANSLLLASNAPLVGAWGLIMQIFYSLLVDSLPYLNINSFPFMALCGMPSVSIISSSNSFLNLFSRCTLSSKVFVVLLYTSAVFL